MDAGDLILLHAIIAEGSVTAAANLLGQPKTTVSRRLRRLEAAIGAPLFDRRGRRLRLTRIGEAFAVPAAAARVALSEAQSLVSVHGGDGHGLLRVASPFLFGRLVLSPYVGRFLATRPSLRAELHFNNGLLDPLRENFDVVVRIVAPLEPYLIVTRLADAELRLYAAPALASSISGLLDLHHTPAIATSNTGAPELVWMLAAGSRTTEVRAVVRCTVNDPESACSLAAAGLGIAALPEFLAHEFVERGALVPVLPLFSAGRVGIYAALPPRRTSIPVVKAFLDGLRNDIVERRFGERPRHR
jgi:LysR family transcriptional regulator for bpeEF and oprC